MMSAVRRSLLEGWLLPRGRYMVCGGASTWFAVGVGTWFVVGVGICSCHGVSSTQIAAGGLVGCYALY